MDVIVCIKRVPEVAEVDLQVDPRGKGIKGEGLVFSLNDWDNYAIEEAVRIKERHGGKVTAITVGPGEIGCLCHSPDPRRRYQGYPL
jgi:electron transfer flavoprotein beta subunit